MRTCRLGFSSSTSVWRNRRVRERVLVERIGGPHDARFERGVDRVERLVLFDAGDVGRDRQRERDLEQRAGREQPVRRVGEAREPAADHVADAGRDAEVGDRAREPPRAVLEAQLALFDEVQQRLAQEERVALGLGREHRRELLGHRVLGDAFEHRRARRPVSSPDRATRVGSTSRCRIGQRLRERMAAIEVGLAVRADHEDRAAARGAAERAQHPDRRVVGPMQVVDHEQTPARSRRAGAAPGRPRRAAARSPRRGAREAARPSSGSASAIAGTMRATTAASAAEHARQLVRRRVFAPNR